jgi:hypothetical protein
MRCSAFVYSAVLVSMLTYASAFHGSNFLRKRAVTQAFPIRSKFIESASLSLHMAGTGDVTAAPTIIDRLTGTTAQKIVSWGLLGAFLVCMRSFYGIMGGTFFLAYMGNSATNALQQLYMKTCQKVKAPPAAEKVPRRFFVLVYVALLGSLISRLCFRLSPTIVSDWMTFLSTLKSDNPYRLISGVVADGIGVGNMERVEAVMLALLGPQGTPCVTTI